MDTKFSQISALQDLLRYHPRGRLHCDGDTNDSSILSLRRIGHRILHTLCCFLDPHYRVLLQTL